MSSSWEINFIFEVMRNLVWANDRRQRTFVGRGGKTSRSARHLPPVDWDAYPPGPNAPLVPLLRMPDSLCQIVVDYKPGDWPDRGALVEEKIDGIRALWMNTRLTSREGADLLSTEPLWEECAALAKAIDPSCTGGAFLDGEWIEPGGFGPTLAMHGRNASGKAEGVYYVFDALPEQVFLWRVVGAELIDRRLKIEREIARLGLTRVKLLPARRIHQEAEAMNYAREVWARGGEGIVIKDPFSRYGRVRSPDWRRVKRARTFDLPAVRVELGAKGGSVLVVAGDRREHRIPIGFGEAAALKLRGGIAGRIAEVGCIELDEAGAMRKPRFIRWRDDK